MTAVRGRLGAIVALAVLVLLAASVFAVIHANQVSAHHSQQIANCVVALHETWAYCTKLTP